METTHLLTKATLPSRSFSRPTLRGINRSKSSPIRAESSGGSRPGDKLEKWLKSPFDFVAFGPRATVGAVTSAPAKLEQLQSDLIRLSELLQDSRPIDEKQKIVLEELEIRLAECVEEGAVVEADVFNGLKAVLPQQVGELIPKPEDLRSSTPEPVPLPAPPPPTVTYNSDSVSAEQTNAAVSGVEEGVASLENALQALRSNESPARENMLKLNLKEARERLGYLLEEVSENGGEVASSTLKARAVIAEADAEL